MPRAPRPYPHAAGGAIPLEGVLERVIYANDDNAWSVVKLVVAALAAGIDLIVGSAA
jgi:hypothetical protein